jgi:hypothetical protein
MSYILNKIPQDFIIVKFLNDMFNKVDLPNELKILILETIGIKYCFQNSIIESYTLEKYSNIANELFIEATKLINLEFFMFQYYGYIGVNYERKIPTKYIINFEFKYFQPSYSDSDESNFYNYHSENKTMIHNILCIEDKYGLDYIMSILKIINEEDINDYNNHFTIFNNEREIIPSLKGNDRYNDIYIEPNNINFIKLKKEINKFNFRKYRHIRSSLNKSNFKRLFPLFEKIKNDKRGKLNIYKILKKR